ncbi:unnamed protein product [Durusdinium trenchii]|uniref:Peptidase M14 domain-containing protein n=1 Tax=Durusdinium trenchii TaxID=1381693 RepID=A0ABP0IBL4_9DINO
MPAMPDLSDLTLFDEKPSLGLEASGPRSPLAAEAEGPISSESSPEDSDGDDGLVEFFPDSAPSQARRRSSGHLNFVDQVSDGIGSYLALFGKQKVNNTVYNRSAGSESARWSKCLEKFSNWFGKSLAFVPRATEDSCQIGLKRPCQGRSSEKLGPCVPPADLEFEHFPGPDGQPRLSFSASFESGNLTLAQCDGPNLYILAVDVDVHTDGYTQWFYFAVRGGKVGMEVTFRLVNMAKSSSLFGDKGMRPVVWSEKSGRGWERGGSQVSYSKSTDEDVKGAGLLSGRKVWFTLSFNYTFEHDEDTVFFAYHYPYTYSHLRGFLDCLADHPYSGTLFSRRVLCYTIGGLPCEVLDVDEGSSSSRQGVAVMTARVHPGESNASWMMHGFISFLLSPAPEAKALRQAFKWLIVPMLNPDGVVRGCYRCGLAGTDLNRVYTSPNKILHPEIYHLKEAMKSAGSNVELFIDLHGHSKKEGIFFYGGKTEDWNRQCDIQLLPRLCCLGSSDFKWNQCSFNLNESKMSTARLVSFLQLRVQRAYVVEASFAGSGESVRRDVEAEASDTDPGEEGEAVEGAAMFEGSQGVVQEAATLLLQQLGALDGREAAASSGIRKGTKEVPLSVPRKSPANSRSQSAVGSPRGSPVNSSPPGSSMGSPPPSKSPVPSRRISGISLPRPLSPSSGQKEGPHEESDDASQPSKATVGLKKEKDRHSVETAEFDAMRLELVGPIVGRAICAVWQLDLLPSDDAKDDSADGLLDGTEQRQWSHLQYSKLTSEMAQRELGRLKSGKVRREKNDNDDDGSDSHPSADEKPATELRQLQKRLTKKSKRQKTFKFAPPEEPEAEVKYKIVVAFGKAIKVPIKAGEHGASRKHSKVGEAVEKFLKHSSNRERPMSATPSDVSRRGLKAPAGMRAEGSRNGSPRNLEKDEKDEKNETLSFQLQKAEQKADKSSKDSNKSSSKSSKPSSKESVQQSASLSREEADGYKDLKEFATSPSSRQSSHPSPAVFQVWDQQAANIVDFDSCVSAVQLDVVHQAVDGSRLDDTAPSVDEADEGARVLISPSRRSSMRTRREEATYIAQNIVYGPGVPPAAGSSAGGSTIQITLPPSVVDEEAERRRSIHQVRPLAKAPSSRPLSPKACSTTSDVVEAKLAHVTLPEISSAHLDSNVAFSTTSDETTFLSGKDRLGSVHHCSFKEWMERQENSEQDVPGQSSSPPKIAPLRSARVVRLKSGPVSVGTLPDEPSFDAPKGMVEHTVEHQPRPEPVAEEETKLALKKVSVNFKTPQSAPPSRVPPHNRQRRSTPQPKMGSARGTLHLKSAPGDGGSPAPLSHRRDVRATLAPTTPFLPSWSYRLTTAYQWWSLAQMETSGNTSPPSVGRLSFRRWRSCCCHLCTSLAISLAIDNRCSSGDRSS